MAISVKKQNEWNDDGINTDIVRQRKHKERNSFALNIGSKHCPEN